MIQNDQELEGMQERIAFFCRLVANIRKVESADNFPFMASGYLAEIEKMNAEVLEYLKQHSGESMPAEAA